MQDITQYYVEVSNLTSLKVRHFSLMNVRSNVPFSIPSSFLPTSTFPKTSFSASGQREIFFVANSSTSCPNYSPIPRFSLLSPPFQRRHERSRANPPRPRAPRDEPRFSADSRELSGRRRPGRRRTHPAAARAGRLRSASFFFFFFIIASDRGAETPRFLLVQQQREAPARDPQDEAELPRDRRSEPPKARIHAVPRLHHRFLSLSQPICSVRRARRATNPPRR